MHVRGKFAARSFASDLLDINFTLTAFFLFVWCKHVFRFKFCCRFAKIVLYFIDEEAKKGSKRRGAPRSAGRTAANAGPVR